MKAVLDAHATWLNGEGGMQAKLSGANLMCINLVRANLQEANLKYANLAGAKLEGARLVRTNLEGANLVRANMEGANLEGANLKGANLMGANLLDANLEGAYLDGANLVHAQLERGARQEGQKKKTAGDRKMTRERMNVKKAEDILCVPPGATELEISKAFKKLSTLYHPDMNPERKEWATEKMKELNRAKDYALKHARKTP
jgi:uncharacterized protein YjbI with pentapeptide repeats